MTPKYFIIFCISLLLLGSLTYAQDPNQQQLADFIQNNADQIKASDAVDVNYCLSQLASTSFESDFGPTVGALIESGCMNGLQACDMRELYGLISQLQSNGVDVQTLQNIDILLGSLVGSMAGEAICEGFTPCDWLGGKIGAVLTCLSVSKETFEGITQAIFALQGVANEVGDIGQDAIDAITNAANTVENGINTAIDQVSQGIDGDAINALRGIADQMGDGLANGGNTIVDRIKNVVDSVGDGISDAVDTVGDGVTQVANDIGDGFCSVFGC